MVKYLWFFLVLFGCNKQVSNEPGVTLELAELRYQQLSDVHYDLSFSIPEAKGDSIVAKLILELNVNSLKEPLYLDFKENAESLLSILVNKEASEINFENEHITIPKEQLVLGKNSIEIDFIAGNLSLNRNEDYLYTLLVPDRARTLFPCFDQPNLKATYGLSLIAPKAWEVLSASPIKTKKENKNSTTYTFEDSDNMSTYLFSFVAGKFNKGTSENTKQPMTMLFRENNSEKIEVSTDAIYNLHQESINFLEDYTQYKFPFKKLDFALIPGFQYGGMEHTGAIQYRESSLFLYKDATPSQKLGRAKLIAHETSHMWFGNLVTMQWFNDVWMKEVFANFMADKIVNPVFKDINHDLRFLTSHYPSAYKVDRTLGANPIRQELSNLNNAGSLYGSIIYNKAPIMMRQLELLLGEKSFKKGIREYISAFANSNADWNDLVTILDEKTEIDLKAWSNVWVNSKGRPVFNEEIKYNNNKEIVEFSLSQTAEDGSDKFWPQAFEISLVYADSVINIPVESTKKTISVSKALGAKKPLYIVFNSNGYGYGLFPNTKETTSIKNDIARAQSYINSYENTLINKDLLETTFNSLKTGIAKENNELILGVIKSQLGSLFWYGFNDKQREKHQADLEALLFKRLNSKEATKIKKQLFSSYRAIAYKGKGLERLYKIWNKEITINNLPLNKDDFSSLAQRLALFKHEDSKLILKKEKLAFTNEDKLKRFEFLEASLDQDYKVRNTFFESLKEAKNREKESWVQFACYNIHHPLNQKEAIKSLPLALETLEEIQATGDIFFPLGWLNSTIGQYNSKEAFLILETYLANHPNLEPNLKQKVLQATDRLYKNNK